MVVVVIAGMPRNLKMLRIISFLQSFVDTAINPNLVKTAYTNDSGKKVFITVRSNDARRLRRAIDGYMYKYSGRDYPLKCWQEGNGEMSRHRELEDQDLEYSQPADDLTEELQCIDQRIELVRKERILIEEESKLLLEKKKLQILKHIGVSDVDNFKQFLQIKDRNNAAEIADLCAEVIEKPILQRKLSSNKLPHFYAPCKAIFAEMRDTINKYINPDNRAILLPLIRSTIKKRLVVVLQGKKPMVAADIVQEYRQRYPMDTDDEMLKALIVTISQSCWPKPSSDEKQGEGQPGVNATGSQSKEIKNETDSKNIINLTNEDVNTSKPASTNEVQVKQMIIEPEEADLIDVDNDFDDWIEEDLNQNVKAENDLNESNDTENNSKVCKVEEQSQQNVEEAQMKEEILPEDSKENQNEVAVV